MTLLGFGPSIYWVQAALSRSVDALGLKDVRVMGILATSTPPPKLRFLPPRNKGCLIKGL